MDGDFLLGKTEQDDERPALSYSVADPLNVMQQQFVVWTFLENVTNVTLQWCSSGFEQ